MTIVDIGQSAQNILTSALGLFSVKAYGARGNGVSDDTNAINATFDAMVAAGGGIVYFPEGVYLVTNTLGYQNQIVPYCEVRMEQGTTILADASFPNTNKVFAFIYTGADPGYEGKFIWRGNGAKIDGRARPATAGTSYAPDLLDFISLYLNRVEVRDTQFISNDAWGDDAGDSCLFVTAAKNVIIEGNYFKGSVDAGIYLSGDSTETFGDSCLIQGNFFENCETSLISKRTWRRYTAANNHFVECQNGICSGAADATKLPGIDLLIANNQFYKTSRCVMVEWADGSVVTGNLIVDPFYNHATDAVAGDTAILIDGSSNCTVSNNTIQMRTLTPIGSSVGIRAQSRTVNGTTKHSTGNMIMGNVIDMDAGIPVFEQDSNQDNNYWFFNRAVGTSKTMTLNGSNSQLIRGTDAGVQTLTMTSLFLDCDTTYIGGSTAAGCGLRVAKVANSTNFIAITPTITGGTPTVQATGTDADISLRLATRGAGSVAVFTDGVDEQLRVVATANAVNRLQITGAIASAGSGVSITTAGSDTNIPLTISTQGSSPILLGGGATGETLRVDKAVASGNAVQVTSVAAGSAPIIAARGFDTNVNLRLNGKGSGVVQFGTHTGSADTAVSGYITIADSGGTTRKLAVIT